MKCTFSILEKYINKTVRFIIVITQVFKIQMDIQ